MLPKWLKPISTSLRPHWTIPASREETLAKREEFRKVNYRPPTHSDKTKQCIANVKRSWDQHCTHIGEDADQYLLASGPAEFESWIDWMHRNTKKKSHETTVQMWKWLCQAYSVLAKKPMDTFTLQQVRRYINEQMHQDHHVSRRARRKDTLSAEDLGILLQSHWKYGKTTFANERQRVQLSLLMLFSAFTGSRPGTLLPNDVTPPDNSTPQQRSDLAAPINDTRESSADGFPNGPLTDGSDAGTLVSDADTLVGEECEFTTEATRPGTICYGDIDLFLLRNPENPERDILMAEVDFRNLKGRPEGADGTKFLMHEDYQLAYCPIAHITSLAFADGAFENARLTPEFLHKLRVPGRLHVLPLRFKRSMWNVPIYRSTVQTVSGVHTHPSRPMQYNAANVAMKLLGEDAGYRYRVHYYCFRRWVANEANRHFTERERNRILGHQGSAIFEKYYHDICIRRDIQNVVLLRPPQEVICRAAAQMNRHRDPLAPTSLPDDQLEAIRDLDQIRILREQRLALTRELRTLYGTVKAARLLDPDRFREYEAAGKKLTRVRAVHRRERRTEYRENYFDSVPDIEIDKQIDRLLGNCSDTDSSDDVAAEKWEPSVPEYAFPERARIADAFFGPEAESMTGAEADARRIQVVTDLVALCTLREPSRRGKGFNWNKVEAMDDTQVPDSDKDAMTAVASAPPTPLTPSSPRPSSDQCPFCFFDDALPLASRMRPYLRIDSLRRHVLRVHLNQASRHDYGLRGLPPSYSKVEEGPIICPVPRCGGLVLDSHMQYMNHSARVHNGPF